MSLGILINKNALSFMTPPNAQQTVTTPVVPAAQLPNKALWDKFKAGQVDKMPAFQTEQPQTMTVKLKVKAK